MSDIAEYLSKNFNGAFVTLSTECCPNCLKGKNTPLKFNTYNKKKDWVKYFELVYPYQALAAFLPKDPSNPQGISLFNKPLIDLETLGPKCEQDCPLTCLLCHRMIAEDEQPLLLNNNKDMPKVHAACMTTCAHEEIVRGKKMSCKTIVPSIPEYILGHIPPVKCGLHQRAIGKPPLHPVPTKQAPTPSKPIRPLPMPSPESPPKLVQPPPAKRKAPIQKRPSRLEKESERGLSQDLGQMFLRQDPKRRLVDTKTPGQ